MPKTADPPPAPPTVARLGPRTGLFALMALPRGFGGILPVLERVHRELGDLFQLTLPGFKPVFVAGPEPIRQVLLENRHAFLWRPDADPVARLLGRGVLVTDGEEHARLRRLMEPSSRRPHFAPRSGQMWRLVDRIAGCWPAGQAVDMLVEMRKLALLIFEAVYFSHDIEPKLPRLFSPVLQILDYIGPGMWIVFGAKAPPAAIRVLDEHLYGLIQHRRGSPNPPDDLLTHLVQALDDDALVRDQLLTMLIAGHDTSTSHLAWTLYLLGAHARWLAQVQAQVRDVLADDPPTPENIGKLTLLDQTVKESLRLYPPIHVGNRFTAGDVVLAGCHIPAGTRVMVSYYLVQRHPDFWEAPAEFRPERWTTGFRPAAFTYVPFGGGPRNCIGAAFAQLEARLVLARLLQRFRFTMPRQRVSVYMGAALEPRPYLKMEVQAI
ncbi:MAG: cytochrome P450 [Chloroflexi bacterium]|nr:MAG: cytochrome P450 [Chloroflexota bacterium]